MAAGRKYYGFTIGTVLETETSGQGRVKVKFPVLDLELTEWCRMCHPYAGNGYGTLFPPEDLDEVLVGFVNGNLRWPIVLGGLYNGEDLPSHRTDDKDQKIIRTRAGHTILLDDTSGEEKITVIDAGEKNFVEIDQANDSITVKSKEGKIVLDAKNIEINASQAITASAQGEMTFSGSTINLN